MAAAASPPPPARAGLGRYALALGIAVFAILSQYWLPQTLPATRALYASLPGALAIVYGVPGLAFAVLVGFAPLAHAARAWRTATIEGLRWYGLLSLLALFVTLLLAIVYEAADPSALTAIGRPNPDIQAAMGDPWFWVAFSFAIGAVEEAIFRGWVFGFWVARNPSAWWGPALASSALFTGVHLYYATTYGVAAGLVYPMLFLLGLAFAIVYQRSGGNLGVVALLHGAFDSAAFLYLVSVDAGLLFRYGVVLVGLVVAMIVRWRAPAPAAPVTHL